MPKAHFVVIFGTINAYALFQDFCCRRFGF